jgi:ribosomal protein S18 acetylase RimI-like enzyme
MNVVRPDYFTGVEVVDNITLRPANADDEQFLLSLYASTRGELDLLGWDDQQKHQFAAMQFNFQSQQYRTNYPAADHSIVQKGQEPIGRFIVDRDESEFVLVDISLLPVHRQQGIGTQLMVALLKEAQTREVPVRLHVMVSNPAKHLYERLGFTIVSADSVYCEMICAPSSGRN